MKKLGLLTTVGLILAGVTVAINSAKADLPAPSVEENFDLKGYMGKWYEIASIPMIFQRQCVGNTTAEYTLLDNRQIQIRNSCTTMNHNRTSVEGRGKVVQDPYHAKLKVTFMKLFGWHYTAGGDYWILAMDPKQSEWALVGQPSRKYGWVLSRTPDLSATALGQIVETIKDKGYDPCRFMVTPQTNGLTENKPLCDTLQQ